MKDVMIESYIVNGHIIQQVKLSHIKFNHKHFLKNILAIFISLATKPVPNESRWTKEQKKNIS